MLALQALCLYDALGESFAEQLGAFLTDSHTFVDLGLERSPRPDVLTFARRLVEGTWRKRERCDELLTQAATQWSLARMPPVDRNILRMGVYELLDEPQTPPEVVINEAVELAQRFGDGSSAAFVNGVLDATWRQLKAAAANEKPESCHGTL
jgi:N utilization substance protein B